MISLLVATHVTVDGEAFIDIVSGDRHADLPSWLYEVALDGLSGSN